MMARRLRAETALRRSAIAKGEIGMGEQKKSYIRRALDLLEENGFYVFKVEEDIDIDDGYPYPEGGAIKLEMIPKEALKNNGIRHG
jgi:hypothetical protein